MLRALVFSRIWAWVITLHFDHLAFKFFLGALQGKQLSFSLLFFYASLFSFILFTSRNSTDRSFRAADDLSDLVAFLMLVFLLLFSFLYLVYVVAPSFDDFQSSDMSCGLLPA